MGNGDARCSPHFPPGCRPSSADPKAPKFGLPVDLVAGKKEVEKDSKGKGKGKGAVTKTAARKGKVAGMKALEVAQQSTASLGRCAST